MENLLTVFLDTLRPVVDSAGRAGTWIVAISVLSPVLTVTLTGWLRSRASIDYDERCWDCGYDLVVASVVFYLVCIVEVVVLDYRPYVLDFGELALRTLSNIGSQFGYVLHFRSDDFSHQTNATLIIGGFFLAASFYVSTEAPKRLSAPDSRGGTAISTRDNMSRDFRFVRVMIATISRNSVGAITLASLTFLLFPFTRLIPE